jgi:hypothetical protein
MLISANVPVIKYELEGILEGAKGQGCNIYLSLEN